MSPTTRPGVRVFSGLPLSEVLATLERHRHGRIVVLDEAAARHTVSGIFDPRNSDQALDVLEKSLPVSVTRLTGMMVVVRSR
jgi:transmembrane sensor